MRLIFIELIKNNKLIATFCGMQDLFSYLAKHRVKLFELGKVYQIKELEV